MNTKKKIKLLSIFALCATCSAFVVSGNESKRVEAKSEIMQTTDLFLPSDMEITHTAVPDGATSMEAGLLFTTDTTKNSLQLKNKTTGSFSYVFEPVLDQGNLTLKTFETTFTSETGESFVLQCSYGATSYASVIFDGIEMGLVYGSGSKLTGNTKYANSTGVYTAINARQVSVIFDSEEMKIYAGAEGSESLVWDMSVSENDGRDVGTTLSTFEKYSVSFALTGYSLDSCSGLLREINDCKLNGITLQDSGEPKMSVNFSEYGVAGKWYALPNAIATDLWDGDLEVNNEIFAPNGAKIAENATTFLPTVSGDYKIGYYAENERGVKVEKTYNLKVFESEPAFDYSFDEQSFEEGVKEKFVGERFYVPTMKLTGGKYIYGSKEAKCSLRYNGVVLNNYKNVLGGFYYTFNKAGDYEFIYDVGGGNVQTYKVSVSVRSATLSKEVKDSYDLGAIVNLKDAFMIINNSVKADCTFEIEYPDGSLYENAVFECSQIGAYTLTATATYDDAEYSCEYTFNVMKRTTDLFADNSLGVSINYGKSSFTDKSGVMLEFSKANTVTYLKEIDVSSYKNQTYKNPTTGKISISEKAKPLISLSIDPASYGVVAAPTYYVTLTDVEDASNTISIMITSNNSTFLSYIRAKAGSQDYVGFYNDDNRSDFFNGQKGQFFYTSYGFATLASFMGDTTYVSAKDNFLTLYYDDAERQLLAKPVGSTLNNWVICDFDDLECCSGAIWQGFKSGKARLSISIDAMNANVANIAVYQIDGTSFDDERIFYNDEPTILLDKTSLTGVKGYSITAPKAVVYDEFGDVLIPTVKAYYVQDGTYYDVKIKDGKLQTLKEGKYVLVYTAIDAYGNTARKEIEIDVLADMQAIEVTLIESELIDVYVKGQTGSSIPVFYGLEVENEIGEYVVNTVVYNGEETLAVKNGRFIALTAGEYVVTHTIIDSLGREKTVSYIVQVEVAPNPIAMTSVPVYYGFVRGNTYELFDVYAIDYSEIGKGEIKADIYVNGEKNTSGVYSAESLIEGISEPEKEEYVTIVYKIGGKTVYAEGEPLEYKVPVKTVYKKYTRQVGTQVRERTAFLLERYFVGENGMTIESELADYVQLMATQNGACAKFVQPVLADGFTISFNVAEKKVVNDDSNTQSSIKFLPSYIKLTLTDQLDQTKSIEILIKAKDGETVFYINGYRLSNSAVARGSLFGTSEEPFGLKYDARTGSIVDSGSGATIATITTYANGAAFEGLGENLYCSFEIGVADGQESAGIQIRSISGQTFTATRIEEDTYAPTIVVNGTATGTYEVGTEFVVPSANAYDVLSNIDKNSLTVSVKYTSEGGETEYVSDVNGLLLQNVSALKAYQIILQKTGNYNLEYNVKDSREGELPPRVFVLSVRIDQAPQIADVKIQKNVKQGEEIKVPEPNVSFVDNSEGNVFYIVYVTPDNRYQLLKAGESILAEQTGTYKIRYLAIDSYGNHTYKEYTVISY